MKHWNLNPCQASFNPRNEELYFFLCSDFWSSKPLTRTMELTDSCAGNNVHTPPQRKNMKKLSLSSIQLGVFLNTFHISLEPRPPSHSWNQLRKFHVHRRLAPRNGVVKASLGCFVLVRYATCRVRILDQRINKQIINLSDLILHVWFASLHPIKLFAGANAIHDCMIF